MASDSLSSSASASMGPTLTAEERKSKSQELFTRRQAGCPLAREELVELHLPLAAHCAQKFLSRGEPYDDLLQNASLGLLKAIDRFDTDRGVEFSTYAIPTIIGEIRRYLRDSSRTIRLPRRVQAAQASIAAAREKLFQELDRSPTVTEIVQRTGLTSEEVMEALEASSALSLDRDEEGFTLASTLGEEEEGMELVELRATLKPLLDHLDERSRQILVLRFFHSMTQAQISKEAGLSQMHVSRLLSRALTQLREELGDGF